MPNFSGIWSAAQQFQARGQNLWPKPPDAPTIGTATAGTNNCAAVTFSAPACTGKYPAGVSTYTATSTPGNFTASGAASPLTVTGLTTGTSYTFKVKANGSNGLTGPCSAASNSITATVATCAAYTSGGTYSWVAPTGVTSVAVVVVGSGGYNGSGTQGAGGGALAYKNAITVTPGNSYTVVVGASNTGTTQSTFTAGATTVRANGGGNGSDPAAGAGGTRACSYDGGGNGGNGGVNCCYGGGGGAGGYSGNGGAGGNSSGSGGSGSGGRSGGGNPTGGGGVGLYGQGASGASFGAGGSGGSSTSGRSGANYGGGSSHSGGAGGSGAVRIVWCISGLRGTPSFPSTNVGP